MVTRNRSTHVLIDLIQRTKAAVRELDNLNYRKMKKILMKDACETESTVDADGKKYFSKNVTVIFDSVSVNLSALFADTPDDQTGGESSKSNSITSEHSVQSVGVSASSQSSSTNSLPPVVDNINCVENNNTSVTGNRSRHKVLIKNVNCVFN